MANSETRWLSRVSAGKSWIFSSSVSSRSNRSEKFLVLGELLRVGIDDDDATTAVDDDGITAIHRGSDVAQPHDGGNTQRSGDDCRVAGSPAYVGRKTFHSRFIEDGPPAKAGDHAR